MRGRRSGRAGAMGRHGPPQPSNAQALNRPTASRPTRSTACSASTRLAASRSASSPRAAATWRRVYVRRDYVRRDYDYDYVRRDKASREGWVHGPRFWLSRDQEREERKQAKASKQEK